MASEARKYIGAFPWAPPLAGLFFASGVGGIVAVFLAEFSEVIDGTDKSLWLVVGDLPSAYLVVEPDDTPKEVIERYIHMMELWAHTVGSGNSPTECFPIDAAPTHDNASDLLKRTALLRAEIIPNL